MNNQKRKLEKIIKGKRKKYLNQKLKKEEQKKQNLNENFK